MEKHGITHGIVVSKNPAWKDKLVVVNGWHRLNIAAELGLEKEQVPFTLRGWDEAVLAELAVELNTAQRQMNAKDLAAAHGELRKLRDAQIAELRNEGKSMAQIAAETAVCVTTVKKVVDELLEEGKVGKVNEGRGRPRKNREHASRGVPQETEDRGQEDKKKDDKKKEPAPLFEPSPLPGITLSAKTGRPHKDAEQKIIPAHLHDAAASTWAFRLATHLDESAKHIKDESLSNPHLSFEVVLGNKRYPMADLFRLLQKHLESAVFYAVCPACQGEREAMSICPACKTAGWMPECLYEQQKVTA